MFAGYLRAALPCMHIACLLLITGMTIVGFGMGCGLHMVGLYSEL
jgi:hypothetical protein